MSQGGQKVNIYIYIFFFFLTEKKTVHRFEKFKKKKSGVLSMVLV